MVSNLSPSFQPKLKLQYEGRRSNELRNVSVSALLFSSHLRNERSKADGSDRICSTVLKAIKLLPAQYRSTESREYKGRSPVPIADVWVGVSRPALWSHTELG